MIDRLERLLNLVIALRETRRPLQAAEIRERVAGYGQPDPATFRRMFERDKADLRALGVPVETVPLDRLTDQLGYRIDPRRYDLPPVNLEPEEIAALAIALQATGLAAEAGTGLLKLAVDADEPTVLPPTPARPPSLGIDLGGPHRPVLIEAQLARQRVRFSYRSGSARPEDAPGERTVEPHGLVLRRGRWYLVGHDVGRGERRVFRLDRIEGDVRTASPPGAYAPPAAPPRPEDVLPPRPEPATAVVLCAEEIAWQVARVARGGGEPQEDGRVRFTIAVGDREGFAGWAAELGPELEVAGPADLRAEVRDWIAAAALP